ESKERHITRAAALTAMHDIARGVGLTHFQVYDRELNAVGKNFHHGAFIQQHHVDEYSRLRLANGEPSNIVALAPGLWADNRGPGSVNPLMSITVRSTIVASRLANLLVTPTERKHTVPSIASLATNGT